MFSQFFFRYLFLSFHLRRHEQQAWCDTAGLKIELQPLPLSAFSQHMPGVAGSELKPCTCCSEVEPNSQRFTPRVHNVQRHSGFTVKGYSEHIKVCIFWRADGQATSSVSSKFDHQTK